MVNNGNFTISVKSMGEEEGTFEAILSAYDVVDLANEKTIKGCFDKTIAEDGTNRVMLWGHSQTDPIGQLELTDNKKSLSVKAKLCLATARGREAYELLKQGVPLGMSIGYVVRKSHFDTDGVRILDDVKLLEGSLTPTPCNQSCRVDLASVKSTGGKMASKFDKLNFLKEMDEGEREKALKELEDLFAEDDEDKECEQEDEKSDCEQEDEDKSRKSKKVEPPEEDEEDKPADEEPAKEPSEDKPEEDEEDEKSFSALIQQINALTQKITQVN